MPAVEQHGQYMTNIKIQHDGQPSSWIPKLQIILKFYCRHNHQICIVFNSI